MNIINVLLGGLCAMFGTSQPPKDEGIELLGSSSAIAASRTGSVSQVTGALFEAI